MKKLLVSTLAAVTMAGVTCQVSAQTVTTTEQRQIADMKTMPLSDPHNTSFDNVPKNVKDIARERVGSARIRDVEVGTLNGKTVYELTYKEAAHPDRTYQLRITEGGNVIGEHVH